MFRLKNIGFSIVLLASALVIFSCGGDPDPDPGNCDSTNITYNNFVEDFMKETCATSNCHGEASTTTFEMYNYETTFAAVGVGRIVGAINHDAGFSKMPKDQVEKISDCNIEKLEAWISAGAPE